MIKTKLADTELGVDFTFFAVVTMFLTLDTTGFALMSLAACIIHEAGHLLALLLTGGRLDSLVFRGGGIRIAADNTDSVFVLIAGSAVNIVLFFVLYFTLPKTDIYPIMFAVLNLVIGLFNLLPIGCLDGSKLLSLFVSHKICKVIEIIAITGVVTAIIFVVLNKNEINFTLIAVLIYVVCADYFSERL